MKTYLINKCYFTSQFNIVKTNSPQYLRLRNSKVWLLGEKHLNLKLVNSGVEELYDVNIVWLLFIYD